MSGYGLNSSHYDAAIVMNSEDKRLANSGNHNPNNRRLLQLQGSHPGGNMP